MRYKITALCFFLTAFLSAEVLAQTVNFEDGFEDGNFTENPEWTGDTNQYTIIDGDPNYLLEVDGDGESSAVSYLSTPSSNVEGSWEFYLNLNYSPSDGNRADIFLMSDIENLEGNVNGYAIRAGEDGSDDVFRLVRYENGSETATVISGSTDISSGGGFRVKVTRESGGDWTLEVAEGYDGQFSSEGTATDNTFNTASYTGVRATYTSTRDDLFTFDYKIDLPPFTVTQTIAENDQVDVIFNRSYDENTVESADFSVNNNIGSPSSVSFTDATTITLNYNENIPSGSYTLTVNNIDDENGETIAPNTTASFTIFGDYAEGDIIINEFAYDYPTTINEEYIEIRNTSDKYLNLADWQIADNNSSSGLGSDPIPIEPDSFLVVSADTTELFNVFGNRAYHQAGFPALNNTTPDAVQLITNTGAKADSLTYNSDWGGTDVALERRSASAPSTYKENWGDSPNPDGGTPGTANEVAPDETPPQLTDLNILTTQTLQLVFDERLDQPGSYDITNSSISSVNQTAADTVELSLGSDLQDAQAYILSIEDAEDIFGNTIAPTDTSFTFYNPSPVDTGDVAINEFVYAPPANSSEYIELYNHSDKSLNLQGWTLSDNRESFEGTISNDQFIVPPDSFVVIAPDNTIESEYPDIALVTMSDFPALNNGGDQIIIRNQNGTVLDSLEYTSDWGGDEIALERRTIDVSGTYQSNWGDAPNGFGTPGSTNEIEPDQTPPNLATLDILSGTSIEINFDEPTLQQTLEDPNNYQLSGSIDIDQAIANGEHSVTLTLASALQNAVEYQITIDGTQDIYGNTLSNHDTTFTYYEISAADSGDVFISEFMSVPPSGSTEYVEIQNTTTKSFDLQDWTINDNTGNRQAITGQQFILPPDSTVVIAPDQTLESDFPDIALATMGSSFPSLNNSGDDIVIRSADDTRLDSLRYDGNWGTDEVALERRSFDLSAIYQSNWGSAPNGFGTPGTKNEIDTDSEPPALRNLTIRNSQEILLTFSEYLDENSSEDLANFTITAGSSVSDARFAAPDSILLTLDQDLQNASDYTLSIENVEDLFNNAIAPTDTSFTFYEVSPVDSGDVAINEFMFIPASESSEYIELYNHSDKSLNLQDWTLSDNRESFEGTISSDQFIVPPDSFVVIAPDNTIESEYPDIALVTMGDFPALNNSGDQIIIRDQNDTLLDSLAYTSDWGGDEVALERRTIDVSGTFQSNWGNAPSGFGTPGSANGIEPDSEPPTLASFEIRSNTELALIFSEQLDEHSAEEINNYSITGSLDVTNAQFSAPDTALLTLDNQLQNAEMYTLGIENIADLFGNTISPADTSFTFYEVSNADSGDVFINEFNFVPPSGSTEYIEIYNPSDESFNLREWTLSDNRGIQATITNERFIVPPDSFVVIAPDNTLLSDHPDIELVTMSDFPALNNGGDQIIIRNQSGTLLDSLQYTSDWGGDEVALERRTTEVSATFRENWANAPNGFGTPGSQNEVPQDQTPPSFENLISIDNNKIELTFSEKVAPSSATDEQNYQLSPSVGVQLISVQDETVTLFLEQELTDGQTYEVTVSNISDIFGNTLTSTTQEFEYLQIDDAQSGQIVINEILYNPGAEGKADFIELYNTTDKNFDLTEWVVGDYSSETTIEEPLQLEAGEYIVLTENQNFAAGIPNAIVISGFPSLNNNTPDDIYIRNQNGTTIDSLRYYQSWGGNTDGSSLERKDPLAASNDASNWQTNSSDNGISAGSQNVTFQEDTDSPQMIFSKVLGNGGYEIQFNEFIRLTDDAAFYAGEERLSITDFDSTNANVIFLSSPTSKSNNTNANGTTIRAENLSDVKGNTTTISEVSVAQPLQKGDLVINEIMFNPLADSDDNQPDQNEYIELRNTQDYAISLEGLFLHDEPDENGDIRDIRPVSTTAKWVPPQGHVLVHADENTNFEESQTAVFFDLESPNMQSIMRADRSSLSLASSDDAIYIADSTGTAIDSVFYDESWHNPNIIDTRGIALERITPDGPSNDDANWGSSVTEKGGTPNSENSIYQENAEINQETGISFNPNPFSPDDDGHEDNLFINYKLDQQDYLIKVRIYDRYGRLVHTLADGEQAGFEGQLIWDGRKDDNSRNRIGIYIVVFEAYDSASGSDLSFKKTVVLARQLN